MVRNILATVALALAPVAASAASPAKVDTAYSIARTGTFTLKAADGHDYPVMVAWPEGTPPANGWPVLYVLDGEDNFAVVVQTLRRLARAGARSGVEDHVVVAIESGGLARRVYDYTPATPGWSIPAGAPAAGLKTGGAEAFLDFVSGTVVPAVAARQPIDAKRQSLIGHSFGGLLGLHAYLTRPAMFEAVVALSPSLWFGGDLLTREAAALTRPTPGRLLIAAGTEERGPGAGAVAIGETFAAGIDARFLALPGQSHGATLLAGLSPGLSFLSEKANK